MVVHLANGMATVLASMPSGTSPECVPDTVGLLLHLMTACSRLLHMVGQQRGHMVFMALSCGVFLWLPCRPSQVRPSAWIALLFSKGLFVE
jgi:hypothetical protein